MILSRLDITGPISEITPICVLKEIAAAHGIAYENHDPGNETKLSRNLLLEIKNGRCPTIYNAENVTDPKESSLIARYVNPVSGWKIRPLLEAFNFLSKFVNDVDPLSKVPVNFTAGPQTPTALLNINACVLYKICQCYNITTNIFTTIKQMAYAVKLLRENTASILHRAQIFVEKSAIRKDLINILLNSPAEIQDPEGFSNYDVSTIEYDKVPPAATNHKHLGKLYVALNDIHSLQEKLEPSTIEGSVALAAILYDTDISRSANPHMEYRVLKKSGRSDYVPNDKWMLHWSHINPSLFDLHVTFNPLFPNKFYSQTKLLQMAEREGFTANEIAASSPYELLQVAHVSDTFYQGVMPYLKGAQTTIDLDEVAEVPHGELFCFGQVETKLVPVTVSELTHLFTTNQNFINPFDQNSVFTTSAINKLRSLLKSSIGPNYHIPLTLETIQNRENLVNVINGIMELNRINNEAARRFIGTYRNTDDETKRKIRLALTELLHLGMYMRGWMDDQSYPITFAPMPADMQGQIALNVTAQITKYEASCRELEKSGVRINDLPLVNYKDSEYYVATDADDGLTIGERINIVKQGKDGGNVKSCIRLSSNWLCASAHKYHIVLGLPPPFDIFQLRQIA